MKNQKKTKAIKGTTNKADNAAHSMAKLRESLKGTPFNKRVDLVKAKDKILKEEWDKIERAKVRFDLMNSQEYSFALQPFRKGLDCRFVGSEGAIKIFIDEDGTQKINISETFKSDDSTDLLISNLSKMLSESFQLNYLKATGLVDVAGNTAPAHQAE